jgi:hypothetical protein
LQILAIYADWKSWICSGGESGSFEGTSEGSDANSQNVSSLLVISLLLYC